MRKILIAFIVFLSSNVAYAGNHKYFSITGGKGSGFAIKMKDRPPFIVSENRFAGLNLQIPFRWKTTLMVSGLYQSAVTEIPTSYPDLNELSGTRSIEAALKKNACKIHITDGVQLQLYAKGGFLFAWTPIIISSESRSLPNFLGLGGFGMQSELFNRVLLDISCNGLFSVTPGREHAWYIRGGIGYRL